MIETISAQRARGFTLLELIVVLGIFAVLSVLAYGGLNSVLETRKGVERALERTAAMQKTYLRLRNDFQQLRDRPVRDRFGGPVNDPALLLSPDGVVELTRGGWRNPLSQPRSSMERVAYRLDEDDRLIRASWRVLDRAQDSAVVETPLLENVENLRWRFLDSAREWQAAWPPLNVAAPASPATAASSSPLAVELTMTTRDWGEIKFLFVP